MSKTEEIINYILKENIPFQEEMRLDNNFYRPEVREQDLINQIGKLKERIQPKHLTEFLEKLDKAIIVLDETTRLSRYYGTRTIVLLEIQKLLDNLTETEDDEFKHYDVKALEYLTKKLELLIILNDLGTACQDDN